MSKNAAEKKELSPRAKAISELSWPLQHDEFHELVKKTVTVPVELGVFNDKGDILMFWRDDDYTGNHIPGTVLQDHQDVPTALQRLLNSEVVGGEVTPPIELGWKEILKGTGIGQNPTRHEVSLLYACWLTKPYQGKGGKFYPMNQLPDDTLPHHRVLIAEIVARLNRHR